MIIVLPTLFLLNKSFSSVYVLSSFYKYKKRKSDFSFPPLFLYHKLFKTIFNLKELLFNLLYLIRV